MYFCDFFWIFTLCILQKQISSPIYRPEIPALPVQELSLLEQKSKIMTHSYH